MTAAILARMAIPAGETVSSPEAKKPDSRRLIDQAAPLQFEPDLFRLQFLREPRFQRIARERQVGRRHGPAAECFPSPARAQSVSGWRVASWRPRPSTVANALLNCPCSSASRTDSETAFALFLSDCVEANITTKNANSRVMKSA